MDTLRNVRNIRNGRSALKQDGRFGIELKLKSLYVFYECLRRKGAAVLAGAF